jgi:hypothetical protein
MIFPPPTKPLAEYFCKNIASRLYYRIYQIMECDLNNSQIISNHASTAGFDNTPCNMALNQAAQLLLMDNKLFYILENGFAQRLLFNNFDYL